METRVLFFKYFTGDGTWRARFVLTFLSALLYSNRIFHNNSFVYISAFISYCSLQNIQALSSSSLHASFNITTSILFGRSITRQILDLTVT